MVYKQPAFRGGTVKALSPGLFWILFRSAYRVIDGGGVVGWELGAHGNSPAALAGQGGLRGWEHEAYRAEWERAARVVEKPFQISSSTPPPSSKRWASIHLWGGSHVTPPPNLVTPCSLVWRETQQPILILSSYTLGKVKCDLAGRRENGKCPSSWGFQNQKPRSVIKQNLLFHRIFRKWMALIVLNCLMNSAARCSALRIALSSHCSWDGWQRFSDMHKRCLPPPGSGSPGLSEEAPIAHSGIPASCFRDSVSRK